MRQVPEERGVDRRTKSTQCLRYGARIPLSRIRYAPAEAVFTASVSPPPICDKQELIFRYHIQEVFSWIKILPRPAVK